MLLAVTALFLHQIPVCSVVCAPLFHSPKETTNGEVGFEGFRTAICTGEAFHIKCDLSACAGIPLADFRRLGEHSDCFENTV